LVIDNGILYQNEPWRGALSLGKFVQSGEMRVQGKLYFTEPNESNPNTFFLGFIRYKVQIFLDPLKHDYRF
jgi:hypothetical protein